MLIDVEKNGEMMFLHIHISAYCTAFTLHSWRVLLMYLYVQGEIACLMIFCFYIYYFLVLLWFNDDPCWGRNWSLLNKRIHKSVLDVIGDYLELCD
jgi:hypothetical protein